MVRQQVFPAHADTSVPQLNLEVDSASGVAEPEAVDAGEPGTSAPNATGNGSSAAVGSESNGTAAAR